MRELPIIFSAPIVLALLAGRKTMTRRLALTHKVICNPKNGHFLRNEYMPSPWQRVKPGARLWVRENIGQRRVRSILDNKPLKNPKYVEAFYAADNEDMVNEDEFNICPWWKGNGTLSCIHMPRWASRLTLVVTGTKIERLHAISEQDCEREGVRHRYLRAANCAPRSHWFVPLDEDQGKEYSGGTAKEAFEMLWRTINGHDAWESNPEVVALTFTVSRQNIDAMKEAA